MGDKTKSKTGVKIRSKMADEKQPKEKELTLEEKLQVIDSLTNYPKNAGKAKDDDLKAKIYQEFAGIASNQKPGESKYEAALQQLYSQSGAYAIMQMQSLIENRARLMVGKEYETSNIPENITKKLNEALKGIKDKAEAADTLAIYLNDIIIEESQITQEDANEKQERMVLGMGFSRAYGALGSISYLKRIEMREKASQYLKATNDAEGSPVSYSVIPELTEVLKGNITKGASLYTRINQIEAQKAQLAKMSKSKIA